MRIKLEQLLKHWAELADIAVTEDGEYLDQDFLHFNKGDDLYCVWHWFESRNKYFSIGELMNGEVKEHDYRYYFLSWFNDFLTPERFAKYYALSLHKARVVINKGRVLHQDQFGHH